jgi:prepilin-type N-terminal cleavage/methylation domain-containing protein
MLNKKQKGFTLVEIAIVLVIIGLLIGGVLKGQEMITNAKIKRIESDNAGLSAAIFGYQDRYQQLPGDDDGADGRFNATLPEGDGNGTIEGSWNVIEETALETGFFWQHLRASGLVAGNPTESKPQKNAYGGRIGISFGGLGIGGHVTVFGGIEGSVAKVLESRLDDLDPATGRVRAQAAATAYTDLDLYDMVFRF